MNLKTQSFTTETPTPSTQQPPIPDSTTIIRLQGPVTTLSTTTPSSLNATPFLSTTILSTIASSIFESVAELSKQSTLGKFYISIGFYQYNVIF